MDSGMQKRQIKVAHIGVYSVSNPTGGIDVFVSELAKASFKQGIKTDVYTQSRFYRKGKHPPYLNEIITLAPNIKFTTVITYYPLASLKAALSDANIVHYHDLVAGIFSFIPKLFGKKVVFTLQMFDWIPKQDSIGKWGTWILHSISLLLNNKFIVVSKPLYDFYKRKGKDVLFVRNGVKLPDASGRKRKKYILFCSRLAPEKGAHYLISAFNSMKNKENYKLFVCGDGSDSYSHELKKLASKDVIFTGWVSGKRKDELFRDASMYVLPSEIEGMSFSLLEAMSYGLPVLVSDIKENTDVVADNGFQFRSKNSDSLKKTLSYMIRNPEKCEERGRKARAVVSKFYSWKEISKKYLSIYRHLINNPKVQLQKNFRNDFIKR